MVKVTSKYGVTLFNSLFESIQPQSCYDIIKIIYLTDERQSVMINRKRVFLLTLSGYQKLKTSKIDQSYPILRYITRSVTK